MKKLILSATFLIAGTFGVLAQGVVDFTNDDQAAWPVAGVDRYVYVDFVGGQKVNDPAWTAKLFENGNQLGDATTFTSYGPDYPEYFGIFADDKVKRTLSVAQGVATTLEVRVYDGTGNFRGSSGSIPYVMGNSVPPSPTDTLMVNFRAFAVPEPSTIALGVLGLGALVLFRRRK